MYCKHNIVYLHRVDSARMNGKVLILDDGREEEAQIEGGVAQKSCNVQNEEIKIEAYDTSSPEVENYLQKGNNLHPYTVLQQCACHGPARALPAGRRRWTRPQSISIPPLQ